MGHSSNTWERSGKLRCAHLHGGFGRRSMRNQPRPCRVYPTICIFQDSTNHLTVQNRAKLPNPIWDADSCGNSVLPTLDATTGRIELRRSTKLTYAVHPSATALPAHPAVLSQPPYPMYPVHPEPSALLVPSPSPQTPYLGS